MYALITLVGIVVSVFFLAGFWRGLMNAVAEYRAGGPEPHDVPEYRYGGIAALSVVASAVIIAGAGFSPAMIYAGPLLALVTAAGCGLAFFVEDKATG
jgi:UDP-N-acetylmuramyl pentapeptide phosphotransferase/UDP-N-acetylglucosamine-1-phosphate transferase